jgi:putative transposase
MKQSKFSDSEILSILKQAEGGVPPSDLCRQNGISTATF